MENKNCSIIKKLRKPCEKLRKPCKKLKLKCSEIIKRFCWEQTRFRLVLTTNLPKVLTKIIVNFLLTFQEEMKIRRNACLFEKRLIADNSLAPDIMYFRKVCVYGHYWVCIRECLCGIVFCKKCSRTYPMCCSFCG